MKALDLLQTVMTKDKENNHFSGIIPEEILAEVYDCADSFVSVRPVTGIHPTALFVCSALLDWLFIHYSHLEVVRPDMEDAAAVVRRAWYTSASWHELT